MTEKQNQRWRVLRTPNANLLLACVLVVIAFVFAQWPPVNRADAGESETLPLGLKLLIAGALPWVLQWASVALFFGSLTRRTKYLDLEKTVAVTMIPLTVGVIWWIGISVIFWNDNPLDVVFKLSMYWLSRAYGAETLAHGLWFDVLGPLTCPLMLRGPIILAEWTFLWTGLSTFIVMLLFAWAARTLTWMKHDRKSNSRRFVLFGVVMLIYHLPVLVRDVMRVLGSIRGG